MATDPKLQRVYEMIGEIATSWNDVEVLWYLIFTSLLKDTPREQVDAIFSKFETGARQRELILAVADATYQRDKAKRLHPLRKRIGQLNAKTAKAAGNRNAAIHAVITLPPVPNRQRDYLATAGFNLVKPNKLAGKNLERELSATIIEIEALSIELEAILYNITPKIEAPTEMVESLRRLGFQVPSWIVERTSHPPGTTEPGP